LLSILCLGLVLHFLLRTVLLDRGTVLHGNFLLLLLLYKGKKMNKKKER
jgi:hypothetical protein